MDKETKDNIVSYINTITSTFQIDKCKKHGVLINEFSAFLFSYIKLKYDIHKIYEVDKQEVDFLLEGYVKNQEAIKLIEQGEFEIVGIHKNSNLKIIKKENV